MRTTLVMGEDALTHLDLLKRAATHKGLKLREGASKAYSEPIKEYTLDDKLLGALAERDIRRQSHFTVRCDVFEFTLYIGFGMDSKKRGVTLIPTVIGTTGPFVPERGRFPDFEVFKVLVENDDDVPTVFKELAASDGTIVVSWTELGLGGIRRLTHLFEEFASGNKAVSLLARNGEVFDPNPYPRFQKTEEELFVLEPAQPKIFETWQTQLDEYRSKLAVG